MRKDKPGWVQTGRQQTTSVDGRPALLSSYSGLDENGVDRGILQFITVFDGAEILMLIPQSYENEWTGAAPVFTAILRSIKFPQTNPSAAPAPPPSTGPHEYRDSNFSFRYPGSWLPVPDRAISYSATFRGDSRGETPFTRVDIGSVDGSGAEIVVWYHNFAGKPCPSIAQYMEGLLNVEHTISFFDQRNVAEQFPAGAVYTTKATRSFKQPGIEVLRSTVCSNGQTASVVFAYPTGYSTEAREMVMRTLSFGGSRASLIGSWDGDGGVLTFTADGKVERSYAPPYSGLRNRGTYQLSPGTVTLSWTTQNGVASSERTACTYSFSGDDLNLNCGRNGPRVYRRSSVQ
jgi:hypothetical protein